MRSFRYQACLLILICICSASAGAGAQQSLPGAQGGPDQWASHQMNQPPPAPDKGLSQERVDEIRKLYEEAKKDAQTGTVPKQAPQK